MDEQNWPILGALLRAERARLVFGERSEPEGAPAGLYKGSICLLPVSGERVRRSSKWSSSLCFSLWLLHNIKFFREDDPPYTLAVDVDSRKAKVSSVYR